MTGVTWKSQDGGLYSVKPNTMRPGRYGIWCERDGVGEWAIPHSAHMSMSKMQAVLDRSCRCWDGCEKISSDNGPLCIPFVRKGVEDMKSHKQRSLSNAALLLHHLSRLCGSNHEVTMSRKPGDSYYTYRAYNREYRVYAYTLKTVGIAFDMARHAGLIRECWRRGSNG
jgi:hypothetical protein